MNPIFTHGSTCCSFLGSIDGKDLSATEATFSGTEMKGTLIGASTIFAASIFSPRNERYPAPAATMRFTTDWSASGCLPLCSPAT